MKTFKQFLTESEELKVTSKNGKIVPKDTKELKKLVRLKSTNLADIDVSHLEDLTYVFRNSRRRDFSGIETWDTSNVKSMRGMFAGCPYFTGKEIENWDVSGLYNARGMFSECENFNADLSNWKFRYIFNIDLMFDRCTNFTGKGLEKWDVSTARYMERTFISCKNFTGKSVEKWDVSEAEQMMEMFRGCTKFNADLSRWNLQKVDWCAGIFDGTNIKNIPSNFLKKFKEQGLNSRGNPE